MAFQQMMKQMKRTQVGVYEDLLADVARMIEDARRAAARSACEITRVGRC